MGKKIFVFYFFGLLLSSGPVYMFFNEKSGMFNIKKTELVLLALAATLFLVNFFMYIQFQYRLLSRVKQLTKKIHYFFHNKYYPFNNSPENDELGHLESSFNSVMQSYISSLERLKRVDLARSNFVNTASHELRAPLTSIKGSLNLINGQVFGEVPDKIKSILSIAESETDRLLFLVNDLLDLAKIESGKMLLHKKWFNVHQLVLKTCRGLFSLIKEKELSIKNEIDPQIRIYADPHTMRQVLSNLLSNAIKFSPKGENITLKNKVCGQQFSLLVYDNGPGIKIEEQKNIFENFQQTQNSQERAVKGSGLGLSIAKAIIELHSGKIGLESDGKKGSCFYFTLKMRESGEVHEAA